MTYEVRVHKNRHFASLWKGTRPYYVTVNGEKLLDKRGSVRHFSDTIKASIEGAKDVDRRRSLNGSGK